MRSINKMMTVSYHMLGYVWYVSIFVIIIPYFLIVLGRGLDYYVLTNKLGISSMAPFQVIPNPLQNLIAFTILALGVLIIIESASAIAIEAQTVPLPILPHYHLRPEALVSLSWYQKVRHPMLLGYLIVLVSVGILASSVTFIFWWIPLVGGLLLEYNLMVEEPRLVRWFGKDYEKYQKRVPALLPWLKKK